MPGKDARQSKGLISQLCQSSSIENSYCSTASQGRDSDSSYTQYFVFGKEFDKIRNGLSSIAGFVDVEEKNEEIQVRLGEKLSKNSDYMDFIAKLNDLVKSNPFFQDSGSS